MYPGTLATVIIDELTCHFVKIFKTQLCQSECQSLQRKQGQKTWFHSLPFFPMLVYLLQSFLPQNGITFCSSQKLSLSPFSPYLICHINHICLTYHLYLQITPSKLFFAIPFVLLPFPWIVGFGSFTFHSYYPPIYSGYRNENDFLKPSFHTSDKYLLSIYHVLGQDSEETDKNFCCQFKF